MLTRRDENTILVNIFVAAVVPWADEEVLEEDEQMPL